jgi:hypothetical protein
MNNNSHKNYWGTILARQGTVSGSPAEGDPAQITYDAAADDLPDGRKVGVVLRNHSPRRRVSKNAHVLVAEPGDPCIIQNRNGQWFLYVFEGVPFTEACP